MTIALVQQGVPLTTGTDSTFVSGSNTVSRTFGSTTTTGNLLIAIHLGSWASSTSGSFSDNKGNTWTTLAAYQGGSDTVVIGYCLNATGGASHSVTWTPTGGAQQFGTHWIAEFSGVATTSALDVNVSDNSTSAGVSSGTLGQANEVVIAAMSQDGSSGFYTGNPGSPWNNGWLRTDWNNDTEGGVVYQIVSATTSVTMTPTGAAQGNGAAKRVVSFKEAAAGGGSTQTDTAATSEATTGLGTFPKTQGDTAATSEATTGLGTFPKTQSDTAATSEAITGTVTYPNSQTDTATTSDTQSSSLGGNVQTDTAATSETITSQATFPKTQADTAATSEAIAALGTFGHSLTDTAATSEAIASLATFPKTQTDTAATSDTQDATVGGNVQNDAAVTSEAFTAFLSSLNAQVDTAVTGDTRSASGGSAGGSGSAGGGGHRRIPTMAATKADLDDPIWKPQPLDYDEEEDLLWLILH